MTDHTHLRDPFDADVRALLLHDAPSQSEQDAIARIKNSWTRSSHSAPRPATNRLRIKRARPRSMAIAMASVLVVTAAAAAAQTDAVRGIFTSDTPSAKRMEAFSITGTPTGTKTAATKVPKIVQEQLNALYTRDDDLHRVLPGSGIDPSGRPPSMEQRFGTLAPDDETEALLDDTWNGRKVGVYARSTSKGAVCSVNYVQGTGESASSCFASFFDIDAPIAVNGTLRSDANGVSNAVMFGLAADEVTGVTVHLENGKTEEALMGTNAFYWDQSKSHSAPVELDVHFDNGTSVTRPINTQPAPVDRTKKPFGAF